MKAAISRIWGPVLVLATLAVLIVLHESGHILAGWATGGQVVRVDLFSFKPNVRIGGPATDAVNAARALAGSGAVLVAALATLAVPITGRFFLVRETVCFFAGIELLGWFLSAAVHSIQPQANDAGKFLRLTGMEPSTVAVACLLLATVGLLLKALHKPRVSPVGVPGVAPSPAKALAARGAL